MECLTLGPLHTLTQNTVYCLPPVRCKLYTNSSGAVFQQSNDSAFASSTAVTLVEGAYEVSGGFIRATNVGGALIKLSRT